MIKDFTIKYNEVKAAQEAVRQDMVRCDDPDGCAHRLQKQPLNWCCRNGDEFDRLAREFFRVLEEAKNEV